MFDQLVLSGVPKDEARLTSNEELARALNALAPGMEDLAANEALGSIGRLGHQLEDPEKGLTELDEGLLRKAVSILVPGMNYLLSKGKIDAIGARAIFGYFMIPFRAAVWTSNYTAYGYVRALIDLQRKAAGKETLWKQSFAHRAQVQQRLIDATAGSLLMMAMVALRGSSGDDDPDKSEFKIFFTGKGPDDPVQRQAWMKRYTPYAITVKTGKLYTSFNVTRLFETLGWQSAVAGALDDRELNRQHGSLRFSEKAELIGAYIGSLTMRSSFQGLSKDLGRNPEQITKTLTHSMTFAASGIVPWKGALMSINRLLDDPPDTKTMEGMIQANVPFAYMTGRPSLNVFGDVIRDNTLAGKAYREGIPLIPRFPTDDKSRVVYDLVLKHGKGPSIVDSGDVEKYGAVTAEQLYGYAKIRGRMFKEEITTNAAKWNAYDSEQYSKALRRMATRINPKAAKEAGLQKARP